MENQQLFTGDNKIDFELWYANKSPSPYIPLKQSRIKREPITTFWDLTFSHQRGVIESYYDSLGKIDCEIEGFGKRSGFIEIAVDRNNDDMSTFDVTIYIGEAESWVNYNLDLRDEAYYRAFLKLNKVINSIVK